MSKKNFSPRLLCHIAILTALEIVLNRFCSISTMGTKIGFSFVPICICAMLYGPCWAALTYGLADLVGAIAFPIGPYHVGFTIFAAVRGAVYGLLLHKGKKEKVRLFPNVIAASVLCPVVVSLFIDTLWVAALYGSKNYWGWFLYRIPQCLVLVPVQIVLIPILDRLTSRMRKEGLSALDGSARTDASQALAYIHSTSWKGSVPGLSRTRQLLSKMGNPEQKLRFIHVVGTNGKGSTCAMLASVLQTAGYRTGLYTSPYIFRFHERMQVNGQPISQKELEEVTEFVRPLADSMEDKPTEFELITCIALEYFCRQKTDIVVLEAGMGGALDSTNVIPAPEVAVICNIGLDHTEYLGSTLPEIARTKAGVVKEGTPCVLYPSTGEVEETVRQVCREQNAPLTVADFSLLRPRKNSLEGQEFSWGKTENLHLPLLGEHQLHNACVALTALELLRGKGWKISEEALRRGLADTSWPGRFQIVRREPLFIVDGGHNPQCMEALCKNLEIYLPGRDITVLTGVMADKDKEGMYPPLLPYIARFVTVTPANPRALEAEKLAEYLQNLGKEAVACPTVASGVKTALEKAREHDGVVLTCGSLYMLGEVVESLPK